MDIITIKLIAILTLLYVTSINYAQSAIVVPLLFSVIHNDLIHNKINNMTENAPIEYIDI